MGSLDQATYNYVNKMFKDLNIKFMNHGYAPSYEFIKDPLFKNQASLYLNALDGIHTLGKTLLDVGCGRGGGAQTYLAYLDLKDVQACDINEKNIEYCNNSNDMGIKYSLCDAENLAYSDESFDIVTSIESSHSYANPDLFFNEVYRVLKPGGIFSYLDTGNIIRKFNKETSPYVSVSYSDITENVINACKEDIDNFLFIEDADSKKFLVSLSKDMYNWYTSKMDVYSKYVCIK